MVSIVGILQKRSLCCPKTDPSPRACLSCVTLQVTHDSAELLGSFGISNVHKLRKKEQMIDKWVDVASAGIKALYNLVLVKTGQIQKAKLSPVDLLFYPYLSSQAE